MNANYAAFGCTSKYTNMKTNKIFTLLVFFAIVIMATSCKNDEGEINSDDKNSIKLSFDHKVGDKSLVLGTGTYTNSSGEDFTVTTLNYFVSNVSFKKEDGTVVKFPNNYFLVKQSDAGSLEAELKDVPAGNYKEVSFMVGVDSTRSTSDISQRVGVLDPASYGDDGMYWAWNSGYIFFKFEGTSSVIPTNATGKRPFQLHVGGFGGMTTKTANNLRTITLPLTNPATVRREVAPEVHLFVDISKVFNGTTQIKLAQTNLVHGITAAIPIADNYKSMFSVDHVHNEAQ